MRNSVGSHVLRARGLRKDHGRDHLAITASSIEQGDMDW